MIRKRPLCFLCLCLIAILYVLTGTGLLPVIRNPVPQNIKMWLIKNPQVIVEGRIKSCSETDTSQSVVLKNTNLIVRSNKVPIKNIIVYMKEKSDIKDGDFVKLSGILEEIKGPRNPGEFDSQKYYAEDHIYYRMTYGKVQSLHRAQGYAALLSSVKAKIKDIFSNCAYEAADVFCAMLLGDKSHLDEEKKNLYQMGGILHILAISGLHISIIGIGLYNLLKKVGLGILPAGSAALFVMVQYGILTGGSVSAIRAIIMFLVGIGAKMSGRIYDMPTAIGIAAVIIVWGNPVYLYSGGFLLSFGAVIAVGGIESIRKKYNAAAKSIVVSGFIFISTLPIVLLNYGEVCFAGPILNLLVLPTVGIVLLCGICGIFLGTMWITAARFAILPGRFLLFVYECCCRMVSKIQFLNLIVGVPQHWQIVVFYSCTIIVLVSMGYKKTSLLLNMGRMLLFAVGFFILLGDFTGKRLEIECLDVGQGDCIVIKTPKDDCYIVDGGSTNRKNIAKYTMIPYLKNKGIGVVDGIFITHSDQDHINGIEELLEMIEENKTSVQIRNIIFSEGDIYSESGKHIEQMAKKLGISIFYGSKGDALKSGEVLFSILWPEEGNEITNINENSMVIQIGYKEFQALLTGDIGFETEKTIKENLQDVDFLKVAHHGSQYSTSIEFLEKTCPELSVVSCAEKNNYGHPSEETIKRLENGGSKIEYTMKSGAIKVSTDGRKMWVNRFISF